MNISIIIPTRNGAALLRKNLPAVIAASNKSEIIVVDDDSTDDSLIVLKNEFPTVVIVEKNNHKGYASTVNTGVAAASGEIVVLLNSDVRPEKNFLAPLVAHFKDPMIFAVGCMDKSIEGDTMVLRGRGLARWERGMYVHSRGEVDESDTAWVSGGSGAFRKSMWKQLGGMDTVFHPFYWEDIDLSYRAVKAGFKILFEPKSVVVHEHEKGVIKQEYSAFQVKTIAYRNQFLFVWKNLSHFTAWIEHILWTPMRLLQAAARGDWPMVLGFWRALLTFGRVTIIAIFLLAVFLRFYNYENRWGLGYDQAHDAIVARYALQNFKIPLVGPFSSAGPFQTGGQWYWFVMAGVAVYPFSILSPWVFTTLLSLAFVFLIMRVVGELYGQRAGRIAGLLAAVSPAQLGQSVNLTNQFPLALVALFSIWSMIGYGRTKKEKYLFFLGLTVSLAMTIHAQGIALLGFLAVSLVFSGLPTRRGMILLVIGAVLPLLPLMVFDIQNGFINSQGFIQYATQDQFRTSYEQLGRRWLTYITGFWPSVWGHIIGGNKLLGTITIILAFVIYGYKVLVRLLAKEEKILLCSFVVILIVLRYVRSPLYDSYVVFLHPFVLIFTAYISDRLLKKQAVGGAFLLILVAVSLFSLKTQIVDARNVTAELVSVWKNELISKYPDESFTLFDHQYKTKGMSVPLSLLLYGEGKSNKNGRNIGLGTATYSGQLGLPVIVGDDTGYQLVDLSASSSAELSQGQWGPVDPKTIYEETEEWTNIEGKQR